MNRLDNYFKERLNQHSTLPSSRAWEKVESRISKKNNTAIVLRIAAAVAAIALITIFALDQTRDDNSEQIAEKQPAQAPATLSKEPAQDPTGVTQESAVNRQAASSGPRPLPRKSQDLQKPQEEKNVEPKATSTQVPDVMEVIDAAPVVAVAQPDRSKSKKIVIVYSLPTINRPASQDVAAVAEPEKRTGLQKVVDVAMEVRASESPLGELREAKDELFAFEFKKDKNKTKN